jgi:hypothetical protein
MKKPGLKYSVYLKSRCTAVGGYAGYGLTSGKGRRGRRSEADPRLQALEALAIRIVGCTVH